MNFVIPNKLKGPARGAVVISRDSFRARLERTNSDTPGTPCVVTTNTLPPAGTIDLDAAERLIDFVTAHLVLRIAALGLRQAPAIPHVAIHLLR